MPQQHFEFLVFIGAAISCAVLFVYGALALHRALNDNVDYPSQPHDGDIDPECLLGIYTPHLEFVSSGIWPDSITGADGRPLEYWYQVNYNCEGQPLPGTPFTTQPIQS